LSRKVKTRGKAHGLYGYFLPGLRKAPRSQRPGIKRQISSERENGRCTYWLLKIDTRKNNLYIPGRMASTAHYQLSTLHFRLFHLLPSVAKLFQTRNTSGRKPGNLRDCFFCPLSTLHCFFCPLSTLHCFRPAQSTPPSAAGKTRRKKIMGPKGLSNNTAGFLSIRSDMDIKSSYFLSGNTVFRLQISTDNL
jgi:hypothetical protein